MDSNIKKAFFLGRSKRNLSKMGYYRHKNLAIKDGLGFYMGKAYNKVLKESGGDGKKLVYKYEDLDLENTLEIYDTVELLNIIFGYHLRITLVPDKEADIFKDKISKDSKLGRSILGRTKNEIVKINKEEDLIFKIREIEKSKF